jgi:hypothetical protein
VKDNNITICQTAGILPISGVDETSNVLIATRSCFRYTALDHLFTISLVQSKKRHEILDPVGITVFVLKITI